MDDRRPVVTLRPVDAGSWRDVAALTVSPGQERFVEALRTLRPSADGAGFALSYQPGNEVAKALYASLGFVETVRSTATRSSPGAARPDDGAYEVA